MFLNIAHPLDSFILQIGPKTHKKYYWTSSSKFFNINLSKHLSQWKLNNGFVLEWLLLTKLDPSVLTFSNFTQYYNVCSTTQATLTFIIDIQKDQLCECELELSSCWTNPRMHIDIIIFYCEIDYTFFSMITRLLCPILHFTWMDNHVSL
jgi:hypothetical protein